MSHNANVNMNMPDILAGDVPAEDLKAVYRYNYKKSDSMNVNVDEATKKKYARYNDTFQKKKNAKDLTWLKKNCVEVDGIWHLGKP